jgi:hypothetical protein
MHSHRTEVRMLHRHLSSQVSNGKEGSKRMAIVVLVHPAPFHLHLAQGLGRLEAASRQVVLLLLLQKTQDQTSIMQRLLQLVKHTLSPIQKHPTDRPLGPHRLIRDVIVLRIPSAAAYIPMIRDCHLGSTVRVIYPGADQPLTLIRTSELFAPPHFATQTGNRCNE